MHPGGLGQRARLERQASHRQVIQNNPQRVNVGFDFGWPPFAHFRGHVRQRRCKLEHFRAERAARQLPHLQIGHRHLKVAVGQRLKQNVIRLHVLVNDGLIVRVVQPHCHLRHVIQDGRQWDKALFLGVLVEILLEVAAFEVFHDQIQPALRLSGGIYLHQIWMVKRREQLHVAQKLALKPLLRGQMRVHHLDGYPALLLFVVRLVNRPHAPLADDPFNPVTLQVLADQFGHTHPNPVGWSAAWASTSQLSPERTSK